MSNTVINQVIANGAVYANGFYGTGLANAYAFRSASFALDVGSSVNRYVDTFNVNMTAQLAAQASLYFYNYSAPDKIVVIQGSTVIIDTSQAVPLTANDVAKMVGPAFGYFFNDSPDLYMKNFQPPSGNAFVSFAGKLTWTHNPANGPNYTVQVSKGDGAYEWRYALEYPIDGNTVGCPPVAPAGPTSGPPPPPPPPPVVVTTPPGDGGGCGCKTACTAMNETYGFGSFRQKVWMAHSAGLPMEYQLGYHRLFIPIIAFIYGEPDNFLKRGLRWLMEDVVRHRTADIWKQRHGQRDLLGRMYRGVFEPIVWVAGRLSK